MKINLDLLKKLEKSIDTVNPEKGEIPIRILGYGEISLVFEIIGDVDNLAYKRIPIFDTEDQVKRHIWAYHAYNRVLSRIGFNMLKYDAAWFKDEHGIIQFYCIQEKINTDSVGNKIIHQVSNQDALKLIELVMQHFLKIWTFNRENKILNLGLDGQISNFAVINYDPNHPKIDDNTKLLYLDTSTPMLRINGNEGMEAVLFLKSAPSFLRWLLKAAFLQDTVDRYYDFRRVAIDLVANFYKEQREELIPSLIKTVNNFFATQAKEFFITPLNLEEVQKYYKSDAQMWVIFQTARRLDRWLKTKVFRKPYNFYLPNKIER